MQQAVQQNPPPTAVTSLSEVKCGLKATVEREVFLCVLAPGTVLFCQSASDGVTASPSNHGGRLPIRSNRKSIKTRTFAVKTLDLG